MISLIVLIFTILIACVLAKYASRLKGQNIYSYIADKHEVHYKESSHALLEDGPVISSGYFVVTSYPDTSVCNGDAYAIAFVKLGSCGVYHANYSDPNAVPQSCGSYVTPTVHRSSNDGQSIYVLSYTFYTDAACTNVGTGPECVQNLPIYASCTADTYKNTSSSSNTSFVETLQIPTGGILSSSYNADDCSGSPTSGFWQRTGCVRLSDSLSVSNMCSATESEFREYNTSDTCSSQAVYYTAQPLNACHQNVFNGGASTAVEYGMGWSEDTCGDSPPSAEPTARPTSMRPTTQPTHNPATAAPTTTQSSPVVTFTSNVTVEGLTSPSLNQDSINAILGAQASSMGISVSDVSYISSTEVFVHKIAAPVKLAVTSLRKVTGDADASATSTSTSAAATGHASARKEKVLVEYDTQVTTRTTVALSSTSYPTTAVLYDSLTSMLVTAVENGTYGAYLRTSGVPELVNAGASGASSSALQIISPTPSDSSGGNSSDALSAGAIAGIVIGAVGFVALCGALFYFLIVDGGACLGTAKRTAPGQNTRQADQTFVSNPVQSGMPTHKPPPGAHLMPTTK